MPSLSTILAAIGATLATVIGIFCFAFTKGKKAKEGEVLKTGVDDALETKKREDARRDDTIDDVVKRLRGDSD